MAELGELDVPAVPLGVFGPLIGPERLANLESAAEVSRALLASRTLWNINSTASGGGVAEMLQVLVGYIRGAGIDARWVVIEGDPVFFDITKRLHNRIHGMPGDGGVLDDAEAARYAEVCTDNADALIERVRPGDVVLLHDPQTAGLATRLRQAGARTVWRCHIGTDVSNAWTEQAWAFLRPHLQACEAFVFSRRTYVPGWVPDDRVAVIAPSIDPFSLKNRDLNPTEMSAMLAGIGLTDRSEQFQPAVSPVTLRRGDDPPVRVHRRATIVSEGALVDPAEPLVVQVSRWDRLKDMRGVMVGFAEHVAGRGAAQLALVGPSVTGVTDDPEGAEVLDECVACWETLPAASRRRIWIVSLPMEDRDENALMVNTLQRSATVVVQKSLVEGFGLTVAEAMWKGKAVVASAVGGIVDQVVPGTGVLVDPTDLAVFGDTVARLLEQRDEVARLGEAARRHVLDAFVGDRHLLAYASLIDRLLRT